MYRITSFLGFKPPFDNLDVRKLWFGVGITHIQAMGCISTKDHISSILNLNSYMAYGPM